MSGLTLLHPFLDHTARRIPRRVAVENPGGGEITYRALAALSDRVRDRLIHWGVGRGDRVGIYLTKSIDSVAVIFGILKTGAAYVPVDPNAPASRNAYILADCRVKALVVEDRCFKALVECRGDSLGVGVSSETVGAGPCAGPAARLPLSFLCGSPLEGESEPSSRPHAALLLNEPGDGAPLAAALDKAQRDDPCPDAVSVLGDPGDLAYILYTSGSTGRPKGVMLSHRNAVSFIDWCSETFHPAEQDRFSSHAPFHFDLSILDIYLPFKHGATLVLVGAEVGKDPAALASLIAERRLTVWYSTPSILSLLVQYGNLPERDLTSLRTVLFAGEVFPIKHLRALKQQLLHPHYVNLYGPTETNVCTFFEIPETISPDGAEPYPIGKTCSHLESRVVDAQGRDVSSGEEGELCIRGACVTDGYWNLPEQTADVFLTDRQGHRW